MKLAATMLALVMVGQDPAQEPESRRYDGMGAVTPAAETPTPTPAPTPAPAQGDPPGGTGAGSAPDVEATRVPPPRLDPGVDPSSPSGLAGRRLALQRAGVAAIVLGAGGYAAMVVGLGLGAAADDDLAPLRGRDDIERRRELVARGELGNRLALGAGIAAGVVFAVGIALVAVARRRGRAPAAERRPAP